MSAAAVGGEPESGAGPRKAPGPGALVWRRAIAHPAVCLVTLQLTLAALVWLTGFRAVSDDDYARVVIAQELVTAPKLDPSGTSWLPLPFWIQGAVMAVLGRSLEVARGVALASAVGCTLLVYRAALLLGARRDAALLGAALAAALPWSARLAVATVPELPVAALSLFALATLSPASTPRLRVLGGVALLAAGLSRYEPWIIGGLFALVCLRDARLARLQERPAREPALLLGAAVLALAAPIAWSAWNAEVHGSALHYLHRVAAYKRAVDGGQLFARLVEYPLAILRAEPELLAVAAVVLARWWPDRHERRALEGYALPALVLLLFVVVLVALSVRGGAPTHHPERALHVVQLFVALVVARLGLEARSEGRLGRGVIVGTVVTLALTMPFVRSWWLYKESFARRDAEVSVGRLVAERVEPGALVLIETIDFGYFAMQAASGRPELVRPEGRVDPVHGGAPMLPHALGIRARHRGARYFVGRAPSSEEYEMDAHAGGFEAVARSEGWILWRIGAPRR